MYKESADALVVQNDTPMHRVGMTRVEMTKFNNSIKKIERMCMICGDFLNELVDAQGKTGDAKFHISSFLKPFFNDEIKNARAIGNISKTLENLANFYHAKTSKELAKIKTEKNLIAKEILCTRVRTISWRMKSQVQCHACTL